MNVQNENVEAYIARYINSQLMKDEFHVNFNNYFLLFDINFININKFKNN